MNRLGTVDVETP